MKVPPVFGRYENRKFSNSIFSRLIGAIEIHLSLGGLSRRQLLQVTFISIVNLQKSKTENNKFGIRNRIKLSGQKFRTLLQSFRSDFPVFEPTLWEWEIRTWIVLARKTAISANRVYMSGFRCLKSFEKLFNEIRAISFAFADTPSSGTYSPPSLSFAYSSIHWSKSKSFQKW